MSEIKNPSACLLDILEVFIQAHGEGVELSGYPLAVRSRRGFAQVYYKGLIPLEAAGWLTSRWQPGPYPRRRLYELSPLGLIEASELLDTYRPPGTPPSLHHRVLDAIDRIKKFARRRRSA
jgi:hypothetical protein